MAVALEDNEIVKELVNKFGMNEEYRVKFLQHLKGHTEPFRPQSTPFIVIGTFILWVCWLFFNGGSTYALVGIPRSESPQKIIMNTMLSGASGGIVSVFIKPRLLGTYNHLNQYDIGSICNGILAGLVSITGVCDHTEPWGAFAIGILGALFYIFGVFILAKMGIDDPVEASAVHGFGGMMGLICVGLFDKHDGVFYAASPNPGQFFLFQIIGIVAIVLWTAITSGLIFYMMKRLGKLRVHAIIEIIGLDIAEMGALDEKWIDGMRKQIFGGGVSNELSVGPPPELPVKNDVVITDYE